MAYPSQLADRFLLRLPDGMRERIAQEAAANKRTMTAELVARLQASLDGADSVFPPAVQYAIEEEMQERGGTAAEALTRLVLAGQANGGTIFYAAISPQTTVAKWRELLEASKVVIPPDATIVINRER